VACGGDTPSRGADAEGHPLNEGGKYPSAVFCCRCYSILSFPSSQ
jgi:hypothetical protein